MDWFEETKDAFVEETMLRIASLYHCDVITVSGNSKVRGL